MRIEFTDSQLSLMDATDKADITRAKEAGFKMPAYTRLYPSPVSHEIKAIQQLFSPAALRVISRGQRYPENATPENCARLLSIWNANGNGHYAML